MAILEIDALNKSFATTKALSDINLTVEEGAICGLLGPNGAGKTTLLRIINHILIADSGKVLIDGQPASLEASTMIGYMPEERGLYEKMRVEDQIMYFGQLKGGDPKNVRRTMEEYLEIFHLEHEKRRVIKELSKGNQQKVQIISTLVHDPKLVILDEPFSGFDPINGALLQDLVARLHEKGRTIMLSSHNMPAVEEMCSSIALVNNGRILVHGELEDIKESHKTGMMLLTTRRPLNIDLLNDYGLTENIENIPTFGWRKGSSYRIKKSEGVSNNDLLQAVSYQGEILHFEEALPTLTDIFISYTVGDKSQNDNDLHPTLSPPTKTVEEATLN